MSVQALPPPPELAGHADNDIGEPWVTTAADLIADLAADPDRGETLVSTGIAALDASGGLAPGTLTAVLAGPGAATTTALVAAAHHASYHHGVTTLLYPLRCTATAIAAHLAHSHRHDPHRRDVDDPEMVVAQLRRCPLYVSVGSPITVARILADALDADMDPPNLIVVDAVALLRPAGASRDLKHLALELNVAVLCSASVYTAARRVTAADAPVDLAASADTIVTLPPPPDPPPEHQARRVRAKQPPGQSPPSTTASGP